MSFATTFALSLLFNATAKQDLSHLESGVCHGIAAAMMAPTPIFPPAMDTMGYQIYDIEDKMRARGSPFSRTCVVAGVIGGWARFLQPTSKGRGFGHNLIASLSVSFLSATALGTISSILSKGAQGSTNTSFIEQSLQRRQH